MFAKAVAPCYAGLLCICCPFSICGLDKKKMFLYSVSFFLEYILSNHYENHKRIVTQKVYGDAFTNVGAIRLLRTSTLNHLSVLCEFL